MSLLKSLLNKPNKREHPFPFIFIKDFNIIKCEVWIKKYFLENYTHIYEFDTLKIEGINISLIADNNTNLDIYSGENIYITVSIKTKKRCEVYGATKETFNVTIGFHYPSTELNSDLDLKSNDFITEIQLYNLESKVLYFSDESSDLFKDIKDFLVLNELNQYLNRENEWRKSTYSLNDVADDNQFDCY